MERSLVLVKPDGVQRSLIGEVMEHRMFPLTLEGLERAMRTLAR